jgi:heme-degrading monooxygenase HmoA
MRFARKVHFMITPGKEREFNTTFESKVLPLLKKQSGFEDELILLEGNEAMGISVWKDRASAETYQKADYTKVLETLRPLIDGSPRIETCDVPVRSHVAI